MRKAKILNVMDAYLLSNPLFCSVYQNVNFHLRVRAKFREVKKNTAERWQCHYAIFAKRLVGLLVKSVDFSYLCCIMS